MNDFGNGRSPPRPWNFFSSSDPSYFSSPPQTETNSFYREETPWKNFGPTSSMNAISFGFVATAILISMFLIMAIIEHVFRPNSLSLSSSTGGGGNLETGLAAKSKNQDMVMTRYGSGLSVVMPGQKYPTCIAQPAPLIPSPREGIHWPPHQHAFSLR